MWCKPAVSVIALDATPVDKASNTLIPVARAKISARLAPGDDAAQALAAIVKHLNDHVPWGAHLTVSGSEIGAASVIDFTGPYAEAARAAFTQAWGVEPVFIGQGGTIPMVADFGEAFPDATILVTAVADREPESPSGRFRQCLPCRDAHAGCIGSAGGLIHLRA